MTILGDKIRQRRQEIGYSQQAAADKSGFSQQGWSMIERGHPRGRNPTVVTLQTIGRILEISPLELAEAAFEDLKGDE